MTHIRTIPVGLGERAYDVVVGPGLIDTAGEHVAPLLKRKRSLPAMLGSRVKDYRTHGQWP